MGETAVDVAKVRSRSPRSSDARTRCAEAPTCPIELVLAPPSRAPEYDSPLRAGPRRFLDDTYRNVQNFQNFTVF